jgi:hypothetical protein
VTFLYKKEIYYEGWETGLGKGQGSRYWSVRSSELVQILCDRRKVVDVQKHGKKRLCCYWKRYYNPENGSNMFLKKCYVATKLHWVHTTALNPLPERTTEAERGLKGCLNPMYRWQLASTLSKRFSSMLKSPCRRQVTSSVVKCEWQ